MSFLKKRKLFNGILGFFVLTAIVSYLIQANSVATRGYQIKDLEKQLGVLQQITKNLESKSLELQSMNTLSARLEDLHLVKIDKAKYLAPDNETALRK